MSSPHVPAARVVDLPTHRRLIEVAFPLEDVSEHSRKDAYLGSPHPQTLHRWWARRPLPACRAFIYASLVDDPESDSERNQLLTEIADLVVWDAVRYPERVVRPRSQGGSGLTGAQLLSRARQRIVDSNGGKPPRLLDPFAGGGAIPLEALRLGCEVEASDLNPVAVLILKGTLEYPQAYGQPDSRPTPGYIQEAARAANVRLESFLGDGPAEAYQRNPLAADVSYWAEWILQRAEVELRDLYPPDPDGGVPVAYLWSRTVPCPNCQGEMPLVHQYWLAQKEKVALEPEIDRSRGLVSFRIVRGSEVAGNAAEGTTSGGDTICLLCRQVAKADYVRQAARDGQMGAVLTAVVTGKSAAKGRTFRAPTAGDLETIRHAERRLADLQTQEAGGFSLIPDEPIALDTLGLRIHQFGLDSWRKLFNPRQMVTLATFTRLTAAAYAEMVARHMDTTYATAITTYLAFATDRMSVENSVLTRWNPSGPKAQGALGLQALPMVWDFAELNPWGGSVGDAASAYRLVGAAVSSLSLAAQLAAPPRIVQRDAANASTGKYEICVTDPPYYNSVDYAGLSDFFYVWLKRGLAPTELGEFLTLPLTPKKEQAIMASEKVDLAARDRYLATMARSFQSISAATSKNGLVGVVFAHTDPEAWAALIEGLLGASLVPSASWPLDTEMGTKLSASAQARLKTSVWMSCRPRDTLAGEAFLGDVLDEMRAEIRDRLLNFWRAGIRGADFFISAIGPGLSVYGRHTRVLRPDGSAVNVRDFLDVVRREATQVALEQVLHGADLGIIDPVTRQYVAWVWGYSRAPLDAGEAIALCLATGADYAQVVRPGSIAVEAREKSKKVVKLRTIRERGRDDDNLGLDSPARPAALIDQLQRAANLWSANRMEELGAYRADVGETRWAALRTLGQAVAECLPDGDEDRRLIFGLLGSNVRATGPVPGAEGARSAQQPLPGLS